MKNRLQKKIADDLFPKVEQGRNFIITKRDDYLGKKVKVFQDQYYSKHHREPKEFEVTKFKKDVIMKFGLLAYFVSIILLFLLWLSIKESGVFG